MFALHIRLEDHVAERHEDRSKCLAQFLPYDRREPLVVPQGRVSLLSNGSERQFDLVHEMAAYISSRLGFTPYHLTIRTAAEMIHLVERAGHFRDIASLMNMPAAPSLTPIPPMWPKEGLW